MFNQFQALLTELETGGEEVRAKGSKTLWQEHGEILGS